MNADVEDKSGEKQSQQHQFQAEVAELLNLMVHSVYSETDIFLRELISNASDACDKVRYEAITKADLLLGDERLAIRVKPDAAAKTLTIVDNGIGMDRQELIENLGVLARSGTKADDSATKSPGSSTQHDHSADTFSNCRFFKP